MQPGKLTNEELRRIILSHLGGGRADVLMGADVGEDCAAVRFGREACVLSTDPITAAASHVGRLAVQVSLNDVASAGAEPIGVLMTVLAPPTATAEDIEEIVRDAAQEAAAQGLQVIGGHTEITDAVTRTVVSTTVVGRVPVERLVRTGGAQTGDALVMTKTAGIEGTAILARDRAEALQQALSPQDFAQAQELADQVSVLPEGRIAAAQGVHAMHDATEGGVLGAAWELAEASGLGLKVELARVTVHPVTDKLCAALGIDALRLISSGVMLMAHPDGEGLCCALGAQGIAAAVIGTFLPPESGRTMTLPDGSETLLAPPARDEIYRVMAAATASH